MLIDNLKALSIHAYYAGEHDAGRRACERLLGMPLSEEDERLARSNRTWYTQLLSDLVPSVTLQKVEIPPAHEGWSLFNPSICRHGDRLVGLVRSSNYAIDAAGKYVIPEADGDRIRTETILVDIGDDLAVTNPRTLTPPDYVRNGYPVDGLEDCRLRVTPAGIGVSATVRDAYGWDGRCRIATASLDLETATLSRMKVLDWEGLQTHEKNWMPIEGQNGWLYAAWHDGHTVTVDAEDGMPGVFEVRRRGPSPLLAKRFRGGSQAIPFRDGWLTVVHEVAFIDGAPGRAYEHRLAWFDGSFTLRRLSPLFAFRKTREIEFAAGAVIVGDDLVVSFGYRDSEAWFCRLPLEDVCRLLAPVS